MRRYFQQPFDDFGVFDRHTSKYTGAVKGDFSEGYLSQFAYFCGMVPFSKFKSIVKGPLGIEVVGNVFETPELLKNVDHA